MKRSFYLDLAAKGLKMPIGVDLVLKSKADHEEIIKDGAKLGSVVAETARRFKTPMAFPLMDLTVEKAWMMEMLGVPEAEHDTKHFQACPSDEEMAKVFEAAEATKAPPTLRMKANCDALRQVSKDSELIPVGMSIGPFSLMTKLLDDPITGVFLAGMGEDCDEAKTVERALDLSLAIILKSMEFQIDAGAKAICVCEPAANKIYISPTQLQEGSDVFERFVMKPNLKMRKLLESKGADLIFHDCGELVDSIITDFQRLDPAVLSLGGSRKLWEDAKLVQKSTVLFGNLPSKKFFSDAEITAEQVGALSKGLLVHMKEVGHPFILGSECDVLSVPGAESKIMAKIDAMISAS